MQVCTHRHSEIHAVTPTWDSETLLYGKLWKNDDLDAAWDRVDFGENMDLGPVRAASVQGTCYLTRPGLSASGEQSAEALGRFQGKIKDVSRGLEIHLSLSTC